MQLGIARGSLRWAKERSTRFLIGDELRTGGLGIKIVKSAECCGRYSLRNALKEKGKTAVKERDRGAGVRLIE